MKRALQSSLLLGALSVVGVAHCGGRAVQGIDDGFAVDAAAPIDAGPPGEAGSTPSDSGATRRPDAATSATVSNSSPDPVLTRRA